MFTVLKDTKFLINIAFGLNNIYVMLIYTKYEAYFFVLIQIYYNFCI